MAKKSQQHVPAHTSGKSAAHPHGGTIVGGARVAAHHAGSHDTLAVPIPGLGTVHLSRPQLAYVAGIVVLTATELVSWPVGLALAAGHLLAADRDSKTLEDFGAALEQA